MDRDDYPYPDDEYRGLMKNIRETSGSALSRALADPDKRNHLIDYLTEESDDRDTKSDVNGHQKSVDGEARTGD